MVTRLFVRTSVHPYVRPSALQGHQYEVAHIWDYPVLYSAFFGPKSHGDPRFSRDNKTQINFINGKKKCKRILSCVFTGRRKVQVMNLPSRSSSLLLVLLRTRSTPRLSSQHLAAVLTPNIAVLVPSVYFCPQPWFLWRSEHIFPGKTPVFLVTQ